MAAPAIVNPGGETNSLASNATQNSPGDWWQNFIQQLSKFLQDFFQNIQQMLQNFFSNLPALLAANGPLLFFVAYQVFFNAVGWPTWGALLTAPFLIADTAGRRAQFPAHDSGRGRTRCRARRRGLPC